MAAAIEKDGFATAAGINGLNYAAEVERLRQKYGLTAAAVERALASVGMGQAVERAGPSARSPPPRPKSLRFAGCITSTSRQDAARDDRPHYFWPDGPGARERVLLSLDAPCAGRRGP